MIFIPVIIWLAFLTKTYIDEPIKKWYESLCIIFLNALIAFIIGIYIYHNETIIKTSKEEYEQYQKTIKLLNNKQ